jgi:hypothetical protein
MARAGGAPALGPDGTVPARRPSYAPGQQVWLLLSLVSEDTLDERVEPMCFGAFSSKGRALYYAEQSLGVAQERWEVDWPNADRLWVLLDGAVCQIECVVLDQQWQHVTSPEWERARRKRARRVVLEADDAEQ